MTLVETMIGMVLLAILMLGLQGLWTLVADQFHDLRLRQAAVFAVNSEMSFLVASVQAGHLAFDTTSGATNDMVAATGYGDADPTGWVTYPALDTAGFLGDGSTDDVRGDRFTDNPATFGAVIDAADYWRVYFWQAVAGGATAGNFVWLDTDAGLVAAVEARMIQRLDAAGCYATASGAATDQPCIHVELRLRYPYRIDTTTTPATITELTGLDSVTVQTVTGQRWGP